MNKKLDLVSTILKAKKLYKKKKNITYEFIKKDYYFDNSELIKIIYELQSGSYLKNYKLKKSNKRLYAKELYSYLSPHLKNGNSVMEAGIGEGTTFYELSKIINNSYKKINFFGFDISLSRILIAKKFLRFLKKKLKLFNADLKHIPLPNNSIDIIYTSHSLEPNKGYENRIIGELLRVSRKYVFLFEPIYELNSKRNKIRMKKLNYVRNLKRECEKFNCIVYKYEKIKNSQSLKNHTGVIILKKKLLLLLEKINMCAQIL